MDSQKPKRKELKHTTKENHHTTKKEKTRRKRNEQKRTIKTTGKQGFM